jgi:hypothetical protein
MISAEQMSHGLLLVMCTISSCRTKQYTALHERYLRPLVESDATTTFAMHASRNYNPKIRESGYHIKPKLRAM